ncbi:MAG: hypothetical protein HY096_15880 [Nitrospinae bacterium]|nr:hypothetical protein [Nitrospinota bacterium]
MKLRGDEDIINIIKLLVAIVAGVGIALVFIFKFVAKRISCVLSYFKNKQSSTLKNSTLPQKNQPDPIVIPPIKLSTTLSLATTPLNADMSVSNVRTGNIFLDRARENENQGEFLQARMEYLKCVEDLKRSNQSGELNNELQYVQKEYEEFVKRDPIFVKLISLLLPIIKANSGIFQSDISNKLPSIEWPSLYNYDRPVAKEDISYALYFAEK